MKAQQGITLMELMVTVTLIGVLSALAIPSYRDYQRRQALQNSLSQLYFMFRQARSLALTRHQDIYVAIQPESPWCVGLTDTADCDCRQPDSCQVGGRTMVIGQSSPARVTLLSSTFRHNLSQFDALHGMTYGQAGTLRFSDSQRQADVVLNNLGRVRICMRQGQLGRYPTCQG